MKFPVAINREGWTGRNESGRRGAECPVLPTMADTWGSDRDGGVRSHEGTDIFAGRGTVVYAPENGRIERTEGDRQGHAVRVTADAGQRVWLLAHLEDYLGPSVGRVAEGTPVGRVGTTGDAAGLCPHVHVELRVDGHVVNPYETLRALLVQAQRREVEDAGPQVLALSRTLLSVASEWDASDIVAARSSARVLRDVVTQATTTAAQGRPDAALHGLEQATAIVLTAPSEWTTPDLLRILRDGAHAVADALPAAAASGGAGLILGLGVVLAGLYFASRGR